jgi:hypothetical protein
MAQELRYGQYANGDSTNQANRKIKRYLSTALITGSVLAAAAYADIRLGLIRTTDYYERAYPSLSKDEKSGFVLGIRAGPSTDILLFADRTNVGISLLELGPSSLKRITGIDSEIHPGFFDIAVGDASAGISRSGPVTELFVETPWSKWGKKF